MERSALYDAHQQLGARFTGFSGWDMPVQYEGTLSEHRSVRSSVGVFDVSHLGRFRLRGPGAMDAARRLLCNDVARIKPGRAQYSMMLNDAGGAVDDVIVWRLGSDDLIVLPNAGNHPSVMAAFAGAAPGAEVTDLRPSTALIAVQGPEATRVLATILGEVPRRFSVATTSFADAEVTVAGTGYTGERGAEVMVGSELAQAMFAALLAEGAVPCGLGARDTLRLEMGYPLWGQDLDPTTTPLEAGLGWVVAWDHDFVGRDALSAQRERGIARRLVGFALTERGVPRHGYPLTVGDSEGWVSSGNFSPTLEIGIGMGYVSPPLDDGREAIVEIRGRVVPARIIDPPFVTL